MTRLLPLCLLSLLAACGAPPQDGPAGRIANIFERPEADLPPAPEPLPPQVFAALPAGVPPSVVQRGGDGCYILTIEVTTPPSGYPLRDALGNPVCEGGAAPIAADGADLIAATPPGTIGTPPLASGNITPPAPLAPLNPG